jgi:cobalamin biosynthetic protein CobC
MLEHGGDLARASKEYGIPREDWLDLSTGVNPLGYPVPAVPAQGWLRLPDDSNPLLLRTASDYYQADWLLPVAGSQAAIRALPRLRPRSQVLVSALTYNEHAHAWQRGGHAVQTVRVREFDAQLSQTDVLIVCNPNNPTGERIEPGQLLDWCAALAARGGWLIVDEAFIDTIPEASLTSLATRPGLIVLRSLGKFFGLAGARVGFVFASADLRRALEDELGPWTVSGLAQFAACAALSDRSWQAQTRDALVKAGQRLNTLLARAGVAAKGTALFQWWQGEHADELHRELARKAILTRRFRDAEPNGIRFGLPGIEKEWQRLEQALNGFKRCSQKRHAI